MALIRERAREAQLKLVLCGAAFSGKSSNLIQVHRLLEASRRGDLLSLNTAADRTLCLDYLPGEPVLIEGYQTAIRLYTVPGRVLCNATRELVLRGADGVVFVVDSDPDRREANVAALHNLGTTLEANGGSLHRLPLVYQYNKRDLADATPVPELETALNPNHRPAAEAVASTGFGVMESLALLWYEVLRRFYTETAHGRHGQLRQTVGAACPW